MQQRWQQAVVCLPCIGPVGLPTDVERRDGSPCTIGDGCSQGNQAFLQFLIDQTPALLANLFNFG